MITPLETLLKDEDGPQLRRRQRRLEKTVRQLEERHTGMNDFNTTYAEQ